MIRCTVIERRNRRTMDDRLLGDLAFAALPSRGDIILLPKEFGVRDETFTMDRIEHKPVSWGQMELPDGFRPKVILYLIWHDPLERMRPL